MSESGKKGKIPETHGLLKDKKGGMHTYIFINTLPDIWAMEEKEGLKNATSKSEAQESGNGRRKNAASVNWRIRGEMEKRKYKKSRVKQ